MKDMISVLVTSAGVASAVNIIKALRLQEELNISIIAVDCDRLAAGLYLADHYYISPLIEEKDTYLQFLFDICKKHNIKALFPSYSREISYIASMQKTFNKLGVKTLLPTSFVIDLCNDKPRIISHMEKLGIPTPKIVNDPINADVPLFSKLLNGSGSKESFYIKDKHALSHALSLGNDRFFQEYIQGEEYTVDILCDRSSNVIFSGPRKRIETKAGQSVKGVTVHDDLLQEYVKKICSLVEMVGACNIQFIKSKGKYYFIEINPRFAAGGLMLTVKAGANLPLLALKLMLEMSIHDKELEHTPNVSMTRYWEEIIREEMPCK